MIPPDEPGAVWEGTVVHARRAPTVHRFAMALVQPMIDVDRVGEALDRSRLWSAHPAPVWFRRRDHFGDPAVTIRESVADALAGHGLALRPDHRVLLQAHLRSLGWCFNPIEFLWVVDPSGTIDAAVLRVTNTPWKEHEVYVLAAHHGAIDARWPKAMHVSPFLGMDHEYRMRAARHDDRLTVRIDVIPRGHGDPVLETGLALTRRPLDATTMRRMLVRHPALTHRVSWRIHREAFRLWRKGVPFVPHPRRGTARGPHDEVAA